MIIPDGIHDGREKGLFEASECSKGAAPIFVISHEVTARLNQKKTTIGKKKRKRKRERKEKIKEKRENEKRLFSQKP